MKKILTVIFLCICLYSSAQFPKVELGGTEIRTITSSVVAGQEYRLHIMLPGGYTNSNKKYPVLYLMDGQWDFPLLTSLYGEQYYDGFIPEMIIVGVTWGGKNPNYDSLRARDYTPTTEARLPQSGGAANFLSFMKTELFPFIETNYKADKNDRILMGCSLGGLFTMYALFTEPGLFQRYVAASPAFGWDKEVIYSYEKTYFQKGSQPPARLYMTVGGVERGVPGFQKLTKFLNDRHYVSLKIKSRILENTGHSGTKGEGFARGLQYSYEKPSLHLSQAALAKYAGEFLMEDGSYLNLRVDKEGLGAYFSWDRKYPLYAASETEFYSTMEFFNITFKKNEKGEVVGLQLQRYGRTNNMVKVDKK